MAAWAHGRGAFSSGAENWGSEKLKAKDIVAYLLVAGGGLIKKWGPQFNFFCIISCLFTRKGFSDTINIQIFFYLFCAVKDVVTHSDFAFSKGMRGLVDALVDTAIVVKLLCVLLIQEGDDLRNF